MRDDSERLFDILEAIHKIEKHYDKNKLIIDVLLQAAIVRYLEIIGEASRALKEETKIKSPTIEWSKIIAFRNFVVHNYFDVDWDIVHNVIEKDIPPLKLKIQELIDKIT